VIDGRRCCRTSRSSRAQRYVDLFEVGIVDPAKVVRIALENAVSVASILPLTEATMTERPRKSDGKQAPEADL